jgi:hypothetical protein
MRTKNKIVRTPGWWLLRAAFQNPEDSREYSEEIRNLPHDNRRWCRKIQAWAIHRSQTAFVVDIANRYLSIRIKA